MAKKAKKPKLPRVAPVSVKPTKKGKGKKRSLLRPPKTLAVVVALKPEAVASDATYSEALKKARASVDMKELAIGSAKFRTGLTGAQVIELPKGTTMTQADTLAAKLGQVLGDAARVTRPVKLASFRVSGLHDSVTEEKLHQALARYPLEQIRVGAITSNFKGMGAAIVSCPVVAVAGLVQTGRVCVRWSTASIQLLEQWPLRQAFSGSAFSARRAALQVPRWDTNR